MKKKLLWLPSAVCLAVLALTAFTGVWLIWLPFHWVGLGLRALSLSGVSGNLVAVVLYVLLGLLPMLPLVKGKWTADKWLLPVASAVLYYVLYYGINPGLRADVLRNEAGDLILAGCFWSLLLSRWLIRFLRRSGELGTPAVFRSLRLLLQLSIAVLLWIGVALGLHGLLDELHTLKAQNTMPELNLLPTQAMLLLTYLVTVLEYCLDAWVLALGTGFLRELEKDPYSESCCNASEKLVLWCRRSLILIVLSHTGMNLIKLFLADHLLVVDAAFSLPLLSIAIHLGALGLSRLLSSARQLKEDNDLFI